MTVLRKHVNILNGFNKVKQQTEDTSEGNMKHLKLGKIQWIALLVVSAMFVNLCSHMVLAAARDGNDPAQGTTAEATTASEATTETTTEQQEETQSMGEYKAFWYYMCQCLFYAGAGTAFADNKHNGIVTCNCSSCQ